MVKHLYRESGREATHVDPLQDPLLAAQSAKKDLKDQIESHQDFTGNYISYLV